mmetsp:Transcript_82972/g.222564  ORF Transcript_82972/g.222564 Transcript_82972/m.222564 type:complete len:223 (-) Transcript_82972:462-1130(-)
MHFGRQLWPSLEQSQARRYSNSLRHLQNLHLHLQQQQLQPRMSSRIFKLLRAVLPNLQLLLQLLSLAPRMQTTRLNRLNPAMLMPSPLRKFLKAFHVRRRQARRKTRRRGQENERGALDDPGRQGEGACRAMQSAWREERGEEGGFGEVGRDKRKPGGQEGPGGEIQRLGLRRAPAPSPPPAMTLAGSICQHRVQNGSLQVVGILAHDNEILLTPRPHVLCA